MSQIPPSDEPQTFGQRFHERGLVGALSRNKKIKSDPNKMHFLDHLEEMRWVIFKSVIAFLLGCIGVAVFLDDSVRLLQRLWSQRFRILAIFRLISKPPGSRNISYNWRTRESN